MVDTFKSLKNSPDAALIDPKASAQWYEAWGSAVIGRNRFFMLSMLLVVAVVALGFAVAALTPLKTVQPYVVKVEGTGRVTVDPVSAVAYMPGDAEKKYFLGQWVKHVWTIDSRFISDYLEKAYSMTRDKAVPEFQELIEAAQPINRASTDKTLTAAVSITSINFIADDTALIRFYVTERDRMNMQSPKIIHYVLTTRFMIIPPETEREILENPIGMFITNFSITREVQ